MDHYADAGGEEDAASIGISLSDGDADDWQVMSWSQSAAEDPTRTGTFHADLANFAGWSAALEVQVRLAMFTCPDLEAFDCGYRDCCDDVAWIDVDDFEVRGR